MYFSMVENVIILQYICMSVIVLSISSLFLKTNTVYKKIFLGSGPLEKKVCELYSRYCESS